METKKSYTNSEILFQGEVIETYPCDVNPITGETESNGGVENIIALRGKVYSVISNSEQTEILNEKDIAEPIDYPRRYRLYFDIDAENETEAWEKADELIQRALVEDSSIEPYAYLEVIKFLTNTKGQ